MDLIKCLLHKAYNSPMIIMKNTSKESALSHNAINLLVNFKECTEAS